MPICLEAAEEEKEREKEPETLAIFGLPLPRRLFPKPTNERHRNKQARLLHRKPSETPT